MTSLITRKIIQYFSLLVVILLIGCTKDSIGEPEEFIASLQICDSYGNTLTDLETHVFLSESTYNSGVADTVLKTNDTYFEITLSNGENFFWIEVFAKDEDDNLLKINLDDKFALPAQNLRQIQKVNYTVTVRDPIINIYDIRYKWNNIKSQKYMDGMHVPWDEGRPLDMMPDVQFIIKGTFQSKIYNNQRDFGSLLESVNITVDDLEKEYEFLLIDNDIDGAYDLIFSEKLAFRSLIQNGILGLPVAEAKINWSYSTYNYYAKNDRFDRPILIYFKTLWK